MLRAALYSPPPQQTRKDLEIEAQEKERKLSRLQDEVEHVPSLPARLKRTC